MPEPDRTAIVHGTSVALGPNAALIRGAPGSGKSDLALRFLFLSPEHFAMPCALVADDRTVLRRDGQSITVSAPHTLAGLIEVRGVGILAAMRTAAFATLRVIVDLDSAQDTPRMPDPFEIDTVLGVAIRRLRLDAFDASAALKLALAIETSGAAKADEPWRPPA